LDVVQANQQTKSKTLLTANISNAIGQQSFEEIQLRLAGSLVNAPADHSLGAMHNICLLIRD